MSERRRRASEEKRFMAHLLADLERERLRRGLTMGAVGRSVGKSEQWYRHLFDKSEGTRTEARDLRLNKIMLLLEAWDLEAEIILVPIPHKEE